MKPEQIRTKPAQAEVGTADEVWHAMPAEEALRRLESRREGLAESEARSRLDRYGPNRLRPAQRRGPLARFLLQFHNILIYVLLAAAGVTAVLALKDPTHWIDTGVILGVVIINAIIGFVQEGKAERALEAISRMLSNEATVVRDGRKRAIPAEELTIGDVVMLRAGDKVAADLRLLESRELRIDEAMLTGESVPAEKQTEPVPAESGIGDRTGLAFSGTLVTSGQGLGVVVKIGDRTEIGRISELVSGTEGITTPLIAQMNHFGRVLTVVIVAASVLTFLLGYFVGGREIVETFLAAVALAVSAIPEGLPAIMTIVLAIGVQRMAKRHAIIRRLPAVDTLGALTTICTDKTGTLTRNEMTVTHVLTAGQRYEVSGVGYAPEGQVLRDGQAVSADEDEPLRRIVRAGVLCNDAEIRQQEGQWRSEGDPMEGALLTLAGKFGMDFQHEREANATIDTVPFESATKFMATLHRGEAGELVLVKGAPERIVEMCEHEEGPDGSQPLDAEFWRTSAEGFAAQGQRVLGAAYRPARPGEERIEPADVRSGLTMLGLFGIIDPPRQEAIDAVKECHDAGIRVVMITGDHAVTARAIGRELEIGDGKDARSGAELDKMDEPALCEAAANVEVFARVSPEHKLKLVQAMQAGGHVVAMTGDGVNDAPALKRADVGIAMGIKGTEVSREAAEMVLTDDNFASIAYAVEEGRTVYDNLRKAILFLLPTNGGEGLTILAAMVLGRSLPITPAQLLWINMVTAVTLGLALAFEPPEAGVMKRPPRNPKAKLLNGFFLWRIIYVSIIMAIGAFAVFTWMRNAGHSLEAARTMTVNTIVMLEVFYLISTRFIVEPVLRPADWFGNRMILLAIGVVVVLQILLTYLPILQKLFSTTPLSATQWLVVVAVGFSVYVLVELEKAVVRTTGWGQAAAESTEAPSAA